MKKILALFILFYPLIISAQEITNIQVTQENNKVFIQYDLQGDGTFNVEIFYSTDDGENWNGPLTQVTGAVGKKQTEGKNKEIVWDVMAEHGDVSRYYQFQVLAELENQFALDSGTFTDERDGEVYKWVKIGEQIWMAENLRAIKYNDGTSIPNVLNNSEWTELSSDAYCWYNNDILNKAIYGALYNWYAVNTGKLCPEGWHVPGDDEWTTLINYLGGKDVACRKMKLTTGWRSNTGATNSSGFSALPGGYRSYSGGSFYDVGGNGNWWSSTEYGSSNAWIWNLYHGHAYESRYGGNKVNGFSVRCLMD